MINKRGLKLICLVLIMLLIMPLMSHSCVNAADAFSINLNATTSKNSGVYDVHAQIMNSGKNFTGTLRIVVRNTNYNNVGYDVDIAIPAGSTKEYVVSVPEKYVQTTEDVYAVILDKSGKKVHSEKFRSVFSSLKGKVSVGILSDHPENLKGLDLSGKQIESDNVFYTIKTQEIDFTELEDSLEEIGVLVIDDYNTSVLPEEKIAAIKNWINKGGILMLGTGDEAERVLSGFQNDDMITVKPGENFDANLLNDSSTVTISNIQPIDDFVMLNFNCLCKSQERGCIFVSTYKFSDLTAEPELSKSILEEAYRNAFQSATSFMNNYNAQRISIYDLETAQAYMEKPAKTGTWLIAFLIVIYVVIVGPILYLVLKGINKREKIWVIIPCLSVLFVGFIFLISLSVKVKGLVLKSFSIIDMDKGAEEAYIFGYNPTPNEFDISVDSRLNTGTVMCSDSGAGSDSADGSIKSGQKTTLRYKPGSPFETCGFIVNGSSNAQGNLDVDVQYNPSKNLGNDSSITNYNNDDTSRIVAGLDGTVTNNTGVDFDYILISVGENYQLVDDVKNGEKVNIDINSNTNYSSGGYYGRSVSINDPARKAYNDKNYDKSGELAALSLAYDYVRMDGNNELHVIGIVKQTSLTDKNDTSWRCYLKTIKTIMY